MHNQLSEKIIDNLQNVFEGLPGLFFVVDSQFKIIASSDESLAVLQQTREALKGHALSEILAEAQVAPTRASKAVVEDSLKRVLKNKSRDELPITEYHIYPKTAAPKTSYWFSQNFPLLDNVGDVAAIIFRAEDITDFMTSENHTHALHKILLDLHKSQCELLQFSQELQTLEYSLSHDLRAPLRAIDGFSKILIDEYADNLPEEGRRQLRFVQKASQDVGELTNALLSLSRLGRRTLQISTFQMKEVLKKAVDELPVMEQPIDINIQPIGVSVGDPELIKIVWEQLITNAIKFSQNSEHVEINIGAEYDEGEPIYFVSDNGVGFRMAHAHKLFAPFKSLHSEKKYAGQGMGLALAKRIVQKHHGRIWAEGEQGKGATFYFTLGEVHKTSLHH